MTQIWHTSTTTIANRGLLECFTPIMWGNSWKQRDLKWWKKKSSLMRAIGFHIAIWSAKRIENDENIMN